MSQKFKKRAAEQSSTAGARRLRPAQVSTHNKPHHETNIKTLRDLLRETPVFAMTAVGPSAFHMSNYIVQCQTVLCAVIQARLKVDGALSATTMRNGGRRTALAIAHHMDAQDIERLKRWRTECHNYLKQNTVMLLRAPPSSGGATSMWGLATGLWLLICHANFVLRLSGVGNDLLGAFSATESRYLTRNRLALFPQPIGAYSLTQLVMTVKNMLRRLDALDSFDLELPTVVTLLEYRSGELICLSGTPLTGYDCTPWLEPARRGKAEQVTHKFVAHSMFWFLALHHYIDVHGELTSLYRELQSTSGTGGIYVPAEQTYALSWFPTVDMRDRVRRFYYEYAANMTAAQYATALRGLLHVFIPLPCDAHIYRFHVQGEEAMPRNILNHAAMTHHSPTGVAYQRTVMGTASVVSWLHDEINWVAGDESVRSAAFGGQLSFFRSLATIFVLHMYLGKFGLRFRFRFVLFHRSPAFLVNYFKARRNGWPFIVQQFGRWCVVVPHQIDPNEDAAKIEAEIVSLSTRFARATQPPQPPPSPPVPELPTAVAPPPSTNGTHDPDAMAVDVADDASSSYSYSYYSESDDGYATAEDHSDDDDDFEFEQLMRPRRPADVIRAQSAAAAAADPAPDAPEEELDDFAAELARMALDLELDENGKEERLDMYRTFGERLPPEPAKDEYVRVYECRTVFDAYTLWAVALVHINKGWINDQKMSDFVQALFGWHN
jgi:hypothetical protein